MLDYSENLQKITDEKGYDLCCELKYNTGIHYEYSLVNKTANDSIFVGIANGIEKFFVGENELIDRIIGGKPMEEVMQEKCYTA